VPTPTPTPFSTPIEYSSGLKFADMSRRQKSVFVAKLVVCIATFGYVFPNVQSS
jgi:hypothetical protein